jgi:hypothetical protein
MTAKHCITTAIILAALLVYAQSASAALWEDPAAMPSYQGSVHFSTGLALNGFVDYAVYAPGDYSGSISFNDDLYVYAYQVSNGASSTVGIDYFSVGLSPDVQVPNVAYDPAMSYAISEGINPTMHFKLPESVIYLYLTDNIGAGERSMTLLFTSNDGPAMSYGYVSGGVTGGENVSLPSPVPEPATFGLLIGGAFMTLRRGKKSEKRGGDK